jgi:hypothetical protein
MQGKREPHPGQTTNNRQNESSEIIVKPKNQTTNTPTPTKRQKQTHRPNGAKQTNSSTMTHC